MVRWDVVLGLGLVGGWVAEPGLAQLLPVVDGSLGAESSLVDGTTFPGVGLIRGGAYRGGNLFHSFDSFDVGEGFGAYFLVRDGAVENVLARVTGAGASQILGILGTRIDDGTFTTVSPANLFLINPNGILFGSNAQLDIGASFVATTATSVQFGNQGFFSTNQLDSLPLLTVSPSAFLFNQTPSPITNTSQAVVGNSLVSSLPGLPLVQLRGLRVPKGESLILLGGEVTNDNSGLTASGGHVEIGSFSGQGTVTLRFDGNSFQLDVPDDIPRANIQIENSSRIDTFAENRGSITLTGRNINVAMNSVITTGIGSGLGTVISKSGDINVNATENILISDTSGILNGSVLGIGDAGNVSLSGQNIKLVNGSNIGSVSFGEGDAGVVSLRATDTISLLGENVNGGKSQIAAVVASFASLGSFPGLTGKGQGGDVDLRARSVSLEDGAGIFTNTFLAEGKSGDIRVDVKDSLVLKDGSFFSTSSNGQGDAGRIIIRSGNRVDLEGVGSNGLASRLISTIETIDVPFENSREGGDILIETGSLSLTGGANINSSTSAEGNAGEITLKIQENARLDGTTPDGSSSSGIFSTANAGAVGNSSKIRVTAGSLNITNGAVINASTFDQGDAGNVEVMAEAIALDGTAPNGQSASSIASEVADTATGEGGDVTVKTGSLNITNGATVSASTFGNGNAGNVEVTAEAIALDGGTIGRGGIVSQVALATATGEGGDVTVKTGSLNITNGAGVSASTGGNGNAGNVEVIASQQIIIDGTTPSGLFSSGIFTAANTQNRAGNITITTPQLRLDNQGVVSSVSNAADGGNIILDISNAILLRRGSGIFSAAGNDQNPGNGGNITIITPFLIAPPNENTDIIANAFSGSGGNIQIDANTIRQFQVQNQGNTQTLRANRTNDISASSQFGTSGTLALSGLDTDPSQGTSILPNAPIDTADQISQRCSADRTATTNTFYITGNGGLPYSPGDPAPSSYVTGAIRSTRNEPSQTNELSRMDEASQTNTVRPHSRESAPPLQEATAWVQNKRGQIQLIAQHPNPIAPPPMPQCPT